MSKSEAWEKVEIARNPNRKTALDYIESIFDNFIELHGDRCFGDDKAMVCGIGSIGKQGYTIIAEQKGRSTKENIERNFGMPNPESYRKAIRFMKQAEKFNRPIITFVDTKGAYSILSPEGYASILWKDSSRAKEAAEVMKLTAKDLYELKVIDKIVKETGGFEETAVKLNKEIVKNIKEMQKQTKEEIIEQRYQKFRNMGEYELQIKANS